MFSPPPSHRPRRIGPAASRCCACRTGAAPYTTAQRGTEGRDEWERRTREVDSRGYQLVAPPSTGSTTPVMKEAASEAKNRAAAAMSCGVPSRPNGCRATSSA